MIQGEFAFRARIAATLYSPGLLRIPLSMNGQSFRWPRLCAVFHHPVGRAGLDVESALADASSTTLPLD